MRMFIDGMFLILEKAFNDFLACKLKETAKQKYFSLNSTLLNIYKESQRRKKSLAYNDNLSRLVSLEAYKDLRLRLSERQKEQANHVYTALAFVKESFENTAINISDREKIQIINACLDSIKSLVLGYPSKIKAETVNVYEILHKLKELFASKLQETEVKFSIECSQDLSFMGDTLFIEYILMNLIGRAIYRVPHRGEVSIKVSVQENSIQVNIYDNGYSLSPYTEELLQQAFDLFISPHLLMSLCLEGGLKYSDSQTPAELNCIQLDIPLPDQDRADSNVMRLFA